mmetsp:Transcript_56737/g.161709  ORF Transcript_56737/g.161709 Transcript_56737/m.161709 type:complete len:246 (+) Transcript_56737:140-877(+)
MNTERPKPSTNMFPAAFCEPWYASGIMAVATIASMAPPVKPCRTTVTSSVRCWIHECFGMFTGMTSEPTIASVPVRRKTLDQSATLRTAGIPCRCSADAPANASGKLATNTASKKEKVTSPPFVMNPSITDSGMPSRTSPSHMDMATFGRACSSACACSPDISRDVLGPVELRSGEACRLQSPCLPSAASPSGPRPSLALPLAIIEEETARGRGAETRSRHRGIRWLIPRYAAAPSRPMVTCRLT